MICLSHEGSEQPNESGTVVKEFGGLPWNLLFKEKPEFASGDTVLNCRLIERKGLPYTMGEGNIAYTYVVNEQQGFFPEYYLTIDDVKIVNPISTWEQPATYPITSEDYVTIYYINPEQISIYLEKHKFNLLPYWFKKHYECSKFKDKHDKSLNCEDCSGCFSDYVKDSIGILSSFLHDGCNSNKEQHRTIVENYKALLLEKIPREEVEKAIDSTSPLGDKAPFFRFCVEQGMLFPIEEDSFHFTLNTKLSIEKFIYLINEAEEYHFQTAPKGTELYPYIWKDSKGTQYSKGSFTKSKGGVRITTNDYKPPFHKEIQRKKRNA